MKVSVITVCYNSANTIRDTLESVKAQSYSNIELIIVDGKSTDKTLDIVREYKDFITLVISEKDAGIYDAMNKGIRASTGDIVGFLNSDDFYTDRESIQSIVDSFLSNKEVDGVYGDLMLVKEKNIDRFSRLYSSKNFSKSLIRFGFMLPHPTYYIKKNKYEEYGFYKLDYRVSADFELITRHITKGIKLIRIPKILVNMREGGISTGSLLWRVHQNFEISRACNSNGIRTSILLIMLKLPFKLLSYLRK